MIYISIIILASYYFLILFFIKGFSKISIWNEKSEPKTKFSVIIPFRNEEVHLSNLLTSLSEINYPTELFEIILVDDDSTDKSAKIVSTFITKNSIANFKLINNNRKSNSPKKDAITTAIKEAKHNWILTTDADCIVPKKWLASFNSFIKEKEPNMVVAPVSLVSFNSFLDEFQLLDFLSMQGSTIGGFGMNQPFMANGANLAYKKNVFNQLNGFTNNNKIASGDDVFLLEDFIQLNAKKVLFLKSKYALVFTKPVKNWKALINQRLRWAAKAKYFSNGFTKTVGLLVLLSNLLIISFYFFSVYNNLFLLIILLKWLVDSILILKTAKLYQHKFSLINYISTLIFHPFFTVYIAIMSLFSSFDWKGRKFSK